MSENNDFFLNFQKGKIIKQEHQIKSFAQHLSVSFQSTLITGKKPGKTILICAGVHGNELNGVFVCLQLINFFEKNKNILEEMKWRMIIIPVINSLAFLSKKRLNPLDSRDLNRCYNRSSKTITPQIANYFLDNFVKNSDLIIDLHSSGDANLNIKTVFPHIRIDIKNEIEFELAKKMYPKIILNRFPVQKSLAFEAWNKYSVPILTFEIGEKLKYQKNYVKFAVERIKNLLADFSLLSNYKIIKYKTRIYNKKQRTYIRSKNWWLFTPFKKVGDNVRKGELIWEIINPFSQEKELISALNNCFIFSMLKIATVNEGEICITVLKENNS